MKIALVIDNSQAAKSELIHGALKSVAEPLGHVVHHYGMYTPEDRASLTYVMNGFLAGLLLNSKAADFVVTGCGTGMGSMLACNSMPGRVLRPRDRPKAASCKDMLTVLKTVDQSLLKAAVSGDRFRDLFFPNCQDDAIAGHIRSVLAA